MKALSAVTNGIVSACALAGLGLLLGRAIVQPAPRQQAEPELEAVDNWDVLATGGTSIGLADAPAVLVTFSDFQCPFCAQLARTVSELRRDRPQLVRMVYRHFPLTSIHPHATAAALASECAAEQEAFASFHDLLYARQLEIGETAWVEFARAAGVPDLTAFSACMEDDRYADRIRADVALGEAAGVAGTPTLFLNGKRVRPGLSPAALVGLIEEGAAGRQS